MIKILHIKYTSFMNSHLKNLTFLNLFEIIHQDQTTE